MSYETAGALRRAIEQRLVTQSERTGMSLERLRRRVVFERVVARLQAGDPGIWVVKGGMALEVRLADEARLTKDLDLGLRAPVDAAEELQERLTGLLAADPHGDRFVISVNVPSRLAPDDGGHVTWRVRAEARLDGREFGRLQLDVSPREHELAATEMLPIANALSFAGIPDTIAEVVDANRHAAEKYHAMQRTFDDRENTRVRDLVDVMLMVEHGLIDQRRLRRALHDVWHEREGGPPGTFVAPPTSWSQRFEQMAEAHGIETTAFDAALRVVADLWDSVID